MQAHPSRSAHMHEYMNRELNSCGVKDILDINRKKGQMCPTVLRKTLIRLHFLRELSEVFLKEIFKIELRKIGAWEIANFSSRVYLSNVKNGEQFFFF